MNKLERRQVLPITLQQAWDFFTRPENLNGITPADLHFTIVSQVPEQVYAGLIIHYKIKPLAGIALSWTTEITHVVPLQYFIDEQRFGPYKFWHHEHHFKEVAGGVEMHDLVWYAVGKSFAGTIAHKLWVRRKLEDIFNYRQKIIATDIFPGSKPSAQ